MDTEKGNKYNQMSFLKLGVQKTWVWGVAAQRPFKAGSTLAKRSQKTSLAPGAQRTLPSSLCDTLEVFPPTRAGCPLSSTSEGLVVIVTSLQPPVLSLSTKGQETPVQVQGAATLWNFIDKESGAWFIMK